MAFADFYLKKQSFETRIKEKPSKDLRFIVVSPCYNEPFIINTLESLKSCDPPKSILEVIIVINSSEISPDEIKKTNLSTLASLKEWMRYTHTYFKIHILYYPNLPKKHAGAGLARKIGMDEAIHRFNYFNKQDGVIISFDADATCDTNFFTEIERLYCEKTNTNGCSVYFEHPVEGNEFEEKVYQGIILYELYLRYFVQALRFIGYPYSFHTIGSCFTVKAIAYVKQGGMNKRQAGEDFYFLHKIMPLGNYVDLNTTRVIPSPRISDRVPFGTGPMIKKYLNQKTDVFNTYNISAFEDIRQLLLINEQFFQINKKQIITKLSDLPNRLGEYLNKINFENEIERINKNCKTIQSYIKHFYSFLNTFIILKYLNFVHEKELKKSDIKLAASDLLKKMGIKEIPESNFGLLKLYRSIERKQNFRY
ncbi:MAG: glycosyltransferase [Bacteroidales bacterium]|nr:glycosyltransferase [Bacteroidales bacterium]